MDPEYELEKVLREGDISMRKVFQTAMRIEKSLTQTTRGHPGYCECNPCRWLYGEVPEAESWHGTTTGYQYHKCRCDRCRKAITHYNKSRR